MSTELTRRRRYPRTTSNASSTFDCVVGDADGSVGGESVRAISSSIFVADGAVCNRAAGKDSGFPSDVSCEGNSVVL